MDNEQLPSNNFEELNWSVFMDNVANLLASRKQLTVNSKLLSVNSKLSVDNKLLTDKEVNFCLEETADLINTEYEAWYRLRLYKLGVAEYMTRAEKARKFGKNPQKYFSSILKR